MLTREEKRRMVLKFWEEYFREGKLDTLPKYVHDEYVQHIHFLPDGPNGINIFMSMQVGGKFPTKMRHVIVDDELIAVHFQADGPIEGPLAGKELSVIDIFSMKEDKFYEHWYAVEPIAPTVSGYDVFSDVLRPRDNVTPGQEQANKELVKAAFTNVYNGDVAGFGQYMSESPYIEHSSHIPKGIKNLIESYQKHYDSPGPPTGKVIHLLAEADLVLAYNSYIFPEHDEIVVGHLLRIWDDKIVEHWDVHTPVPPPEEFQHPNGMY
jgi:predicted SnoaL-like aldol condensation-catalyzing enzyme